MKAIRTPENRFADLPDYDFAAQYVEVDGLRQHYLDEGSTDASPVLLLHGEPSWSFLYRHMIPPIVDAGLRAVAPDLIGFGKSDKPLKRDDYSFAGHVEWLRQFVERLDLRNITLVCQDWGSLIGLRVAIENSERFARIVLANGGLPTGEQEMPGAFLMWQRFAKWSPWFPTGRIVQSGTIRKLSAAERRAYDAPFPSSRYKAGARAFPQLVPTTYDDPAASANRDAWSQYEQWQKPFLTAFSNRDPITRGGAAPFRERVPGARDQPHTIIKGAGHFLQEDAGPELARHVIEFATSSR